MYFYIINFSVINLRLTNERFKLKYCIGRYSSIGRVSNCDFDGYRFNSCYLPKILNQIILKTTQIVSKTKKLTFLKNPKIHKYFPFKAHLPIKKNKKEKPEVNVYGFSFTLDLIKKFVAWKYYNVEAFLKKNYLNSFSTFYSNIMLRRNFFGLKFFNLNFFANNNQLILINNNTNQLYITLLRNNKYLISFSTGATLYFLQMFQKKLKKSIKSFVLQMKVLTSLLNNLYPKDWLIFNVFGTKKNFFKWLNFLKYSLNNPKILLYIYTPNMFQTPIKIKKIKSIKRKFKKEYVYNEKL